MVTHHLPHPISTMRRKFGPATELSVCVSSLQQAIVPGVVLDLANLIPDLQRMFLFTVCAVEEFLVS